MARKYKLCVAVWFFFILFNKYTPFYSNDQGKGKKNLEEKECFIRDFTLGNSLPMESPSPGKNAEWEPFGEFIDNKQTNKCPIYKPKFS